MWLFSSLLFIGLSVSLSLSLWPPTSCSYRDQVIIIPRLWQARHWQAPIGQKAANWRAPNAIECARSKWALKSSGKERLELVCALPRGQLGKRAAQKSSAKEQQMSSK